MKKSKLMLLGLSSVFALTLGSCSNPSVQEENLDNEPNLTTKSVADFSKGASKYFEVSHGWSNGDVFNVTWDKDNVSYDDGLNLSITGELDALKAGEVRSIDDFGYGNYQVRMKPMKVNGTCSAFFIYTGESFGTKHNEIDIEFLGKDTTKLQFNYFTDGKGNHEHMIDLGFDASLEYHDYGFRWTEDSITWYVDGSAKYKVSQEIPMTPGRIFMNSWAGTKGADGWMGHFAGANDGCVTSYKEVRYEQLNGKAYEPSSKIPADPGEELQYSPINLEFKANAPEFIVANNADKTSTTVTYENVSNADASYKNIDATLPESAKTARAFKMKITNNGEDLVNARVDITDGVAGNIALNKSATQDGNPVRTDLEWGGSFFAVNPGKTVEIVVLFDAEPKNVVVFLDSFGYQDTNVYKGNVTLSEFMVTNKASNPDPDTGKDPDPDTGSDVEVTVPEAVEGAETLKFTTDRPEYTITNKGHASIINYKDIKGNTYGTIYNKFDHDVTSSNKATITLVNNTDTIANVRIDMQASPLAGLEKNFINTSASQDGETARTDMEWGGSFFTLKAKQTSTAVINYQENKLEALVAFIDSMDGTENKYSGSVTIANIILEGNKAPDTGTETGPVIPDAIKNAETLDFTTDASEYTITGKGHAAVIDYKDVVGNTYKTIYTPFNHDVKATNKVTLTLINNTDTVSNVRIDMQAEPSAGLEKNFINTSASQDGETARTDMEWGGSFFTLKAKQTSTVVINYTKDLLHGMVAFIDSMDGTENKYSGSITIANVVLTTEGATDPDQGETTTAENISFSSDFAGYQITNNGTSTDVVYTDAKGKTWKCMTTMFENDITTYTTLTLKIKNNGENESNVRIDILNAENKCLNTKATMNDGDVFTDMEWGGSFFVIQAGQEVSISITFTTGSADKVNVFIDSHVNDELLRSGSITVSDFIFA